MTIKYVGNAYADPVHEVLFDMTTHFWNFHHTQMYCTDLLEELGGTRGLYEFLFMQATLFQQTWDSIPEDARKDYYESVDEFLDAAIAEYRGSAIGKTRIIQQTIAFTDTGYNGCSYAHPRKELT